MVCIIQEGSWTIIDFVEYVLFEGLEHTDTTRHLFLCSHCRECQQRFDPMGVEGRHQDFSMNAELELFRSWFFPDGSRDNTGESTISALILLALLLCSSTGLPLECWIYKWAFLCLQLSLVPLADYRMSDCARGMHWNLYLPRPLVHYWVQHLLGAKLCIYKPFCT